MRHCELEDEINEKNFPSDDLDPPLWCGMDLWLPEWLGET